MSGSQDEVFRVRGGNPIGGLYRPSGNKNEALPAVAAAVLARGPVTLENMPDILDVRTMIEIASRLGASLSWNGDKHLTLTATELCGDELHEDMARSIRGSFLFSAPLLARRGKVRLPKPGGDKIGRRRVDTHLLALQALGARIQLDDEGYELRLDGRFQGADVFLDEASVMATENAVMAAATAQGTTRIANAASEPHVQGLCRLLVAMGAKIRGIGTNLLEIEGVEALGAARHRIGPDHIEIGSFIGLAAVTGGELQVAEVRPDDMRMIRMVFRRLGIHTEPQGEGLLVPGGQELEIQTDVHDAIPKVDDAPWPGFPADLVSIALVIATQARGTVLVHEKLFESRMFFVDHLVGMGAKIVLCDPHRAVVVGPARLHGATITSPDIRAGMAMLIAALAAEGPSVIQNIRQIDRGYAHIDQRLRALGAEIERA
ncbi:MAG: UDP-N-acetylglucosamine 1-carboxyvinyltransferase [Planctomycetes bacterium]|nr:UDP-N-acetylglucosamine 1-carboxyvinyltransferase [Planctomycetota bacterium]